MPCATDYRYEDNCELQNLTRIACTMAQVLTRGGGIEDLTQEAKDWIRKHNLEDERREERERAERRLLEARQHALNKLTPAERRILGLE